MIPEAVIAPDAETSPTADTVNTSTPDVSFTSNKFPLFESVTVNNSPLEPDTVNIILPWLLWVKVVKVSVLVILEFSTSWVSENLGSIFVEPFPLTVIADCVNEFNDAFLYDESTFKVLEDAIVPPPFKPSPAIIDTVEWSMCSFATYPVVLWISTWTEPLITPWVFLKSISSSEPNFPLLNLL